MVRNDPEIERHLAKTGLHHLSGEGATFTISIKKNHEISSVGRKDFATRPQLVQNPVGILV
jgi:hypothetical protein